MIGISQRGITLDSDAVPHQRAAFDRCACLFLPGLLETFLVARILRHLESDSFAPACHEDRSGKEFSRDVTIGGRSSALHAVHVVLNDPRLFRWVEEVTGCRPIGCFSGRIFRTIPGGDHHLDWHDDRADGNRLVGLSIDLSPRPYAGGRLQVRRKRSRQPLFAAGPLLPGDAHLFRVAADLQHRLTRMEGTAPRTAAAGWFMSAPDRVTLLKRLSASGDDAPMAGERS